MSQKFRYILIMKEQTEPKDNTKAKVSKSAHEVDLIIMKYTVILQKWKIIMKLFNGWQILSGF